jgi:serine/threonine-protein kinase
MAITTAGSFLDLLREHRLLKPEEIDELTRTPDAAETEPRVLGQALVEMGWLTPFQLDRLLSGRPQDLTLGNYQLLERLGQGEGGPSYKARRPGKLGVLTLKVIPKARLATPEATAKFMADVRLAAQLQHEYIAPLVTVGQVGGIYLCAREYAEGTDLDKQVRQSGPLSPTRACTAIRQAALALQFAADKGLVHGRVKPSNLIAATPGANGTTGSIHVRLVDFGLAQLAKSASSAADLHNLGHTLLFLLTGKTLAELADHPQALAVLPPGVLAVLEKLSADRPEDRYPSAAAAAEALEPLCQEPPPEPELAATQPVPLDEIAAAIAFPMPVDVPAMNGTTVTATVPEVEASFPMAIPFTETVTPEPVDFPMAVPIVETVASPDVESVETVAVTAVPPTDELPVATVSATTEATPLPTEPVPLEGIAIPIDGVAVVESVPADAVVPVPEPIVAAAEPDLPVATAVEVVADPPPTEEMPALPLVTIASEPAAAEVPAITPVTVATEPTPEDLPVATAVLAIAEPLAVPEEKPSDPTPVDVPLATATVAVNEPVAAEKPSEPPVEVPLIDTAPVVSEPAMSAPELIAAPPQELAPPVVEETPLPPAVSEAPPPPEPVMPQLELTESKPETPAPEVGYATSIPSEAPPLPGPGYATSIPSEAPPLAAPPIETLAAAPAADAISPTLPETPAYQPPHDPFAADAPTTEEAGAFTGRPERMPEKRKKKLFSLKNLTKTQILWLVLGALLNLVVAPVLIYFIVMQLTSDSPSKPKQPAPRRSASHKAS